MAALNGGDTSRIVMSLFHIHLVRESIPQGFQRQQSRYFSGMLLIELACSSFRCTLSLYWQCVYVPSATAGQSELNEPRIWAGNKHPNTRTPYHHVAFFNLYTDVLPIRNDIIRMSGADRTWYCHEPFERGRNATGWKVFFLCRRESTGIRYVELPAFYPTANIRSWYGHP